MRNNRLTYASVLIGILCIAISCNVQKRINKAEALLSQKGKLAQICADRFPLKDSIVYKDSIKYDTMYEGIYSIDTVYKGDSVVKVYLTSPAKVVTKQVVKYSYIYRENTAKIADCQKKNEELVNKIVKFEEERAKTIRELNEWKSVAKKRGWFLWILLVLAIGITFRKNIVNLLGKLVGVKKW